MSYHKTIGRMTRLVAMVWHIAGRPPGPHSGGRMQTQGTSFPRSFSSKRSLSVANHTSE
jgi:hypothetical protein